MTMPLTRLYAFACSTLHSNCMHQAARKSYVCFCTRPLYKQQTMPALTWIFQGIAKDSMDQALPFTWSMELTWSITRLERMTSQRLGLTTVLPIWLRAVSLPVSNKDFEQPSIDWSYITTQQFRWRTTLPSVSSGDGASATYFTAHPLTQCLSFVFV